MKFLVSLSVLVIGGWISSAHGQTLEIKPTGTVGPQGAGKFEFELKNPGMKKLAVVNPVLKVYYKGVELPNSDYVAIKNPGAVSGSIRIQNPVIPAGKAKVKLKVALDDGTTLDKEAEVDFKKNEPEPGPGPGPINPITPLIPPIIGQQMLP